MQRRFFLALVLSLLILLGWSSLVSKLYHFEKKEVTHIQPPPSPAIPPPPSPDSHSSPKEPEDLPAINLSWDNLGLTFSEGRAAIKEAFFKRYHNYKFPLKYGFELKDTKLSFKKTESTPDSLTFVYADRDKKITKGFIISNSNYTIELIIEVQNLSNLPQSINLGLVLGTLNFSGDRIESGYQDVAISTTDKTLHLNGRQDKSFSEVKFLALRDRYFCTILEPLVKDNYLAKIRKLNAQESEISLELKPITLTSGQKIEQKFRIYLGPQELRLIKAINPAWAEVIYYGTFDFIAQILLQILNFFYQVMHNWGWAIVVLSLLIYFFLYPLSLKQMRSMKEMQALQPKIEELRNLYKNNPQRLNKEIMQLYREHKVNPFGGCLPLILQIPIFFALYQVLMRLVSLKGAHFLWIKDLSAPDRLFILPISLPILGNEINILPIIMTIGMFMQQKLSTATAATASSEQQRLMMLIFPLMFGFIFYHMSSGLVLYWFINSGLMLWQQIKIHKKR